MSELKKVLMTGVGHYFPIVNGVMPGRRLRKTQRITPYGEDNDFDGDATTLNDTDAVDAFECFVQTIEELSIVMGLSKEAVLQMVQRPKQCEFISSARSFGRTLSVNSKILGSIGDTCCFGEPRIDAQDMQRDRIERLRHDPHSSYYLPPYFSIFGSNRPLVEHPALLPKSKVSKNVRPKGTHTHRRFYR